MPVGLLRGVRPRLELFAWRRGRPGALRFSAGLVRVQVGARRAACRWTARSALAARLDETRFKLTVSVRGPGRVISSPSGIACASRCTATFSRGVTRCSSGTTGQGGEACPLGRRLQGLADLHVANDCGSRGDGAVPALRRPCGTHGIQARVLKMMYAGCGFAPAKHPAPSAVAAEFPGALLLCRQRVRPALDRTGISPLGYWCPKVRIGVRFGPSRCNGSASVRTCPPAPVGRPAPRGGEWLPSPQRTVLTSIEKETEDLRGCF